MTTSARHVFPQPVCQRQEMISIADDSLVIAGGDLLLAIFFIIGGLLEESVAVIGPKHWTQDLRLQSADAFPRDGPINVIGNFQIFARRLKLAYQDVVFKIDTHGPSGNFLRGV